MEIDKPRVIILRTAGTNCSYETAYALKKAGADVDLIHVNQLMKEKGLLDSYQIFILILLSNYINYKTELIISCR